MFGFLKKIFGPAKLPAKYRAEIESEGILLLDEGVLASVTRTNFHRPGKYAAWEKRGFYAHVTLTNTRLLALNGASPVINVPLSDERLAEMSFTEAEGILHVKFDAGLFQPTWSGTIEYRFHTPQARTYVEKLAQAER